MPLRRATQRTPFQETERPTKGGTATTSSAVALTWPIPLGMRCGRPDQTRDRQASEWRSPQLLFSPVDSSVQLFKGLRHPSVLRLPMVESPKGSWTHPLIRSQFHCPLAMSAGCTAFRRLSKGLDRMSAVAES